MIYKGPRTMPTRFTRVTPRKLKKKILKRRPLVIDSTTGRAIGTNSDGASSDSNDEGDFRIY